ncbi:MAG: sigma-70 family RNA polymerase sigma factor [Acidobacteria bacterium]|nr:sigma-70 family RNA polymerase sigma factor [Acidobacteriota bacterium]
MSPIASDQELRTTTRTLTAGELTGVLRRWSGGEKEALDELVPLVYEDLLRIARRQFRGERADHTLEATALVHEVFLRLTGGESVDWQDRTHFFRLAASLMRRTLVDHARRLHRRKRGGDFQRVPLEAAEVVESPQLEELLALSAALEDLDRVDPLKAQIVELRFFAGLSESEVAELLGVSRMTVSRDWKVARLRLRRAMEA